MTMTATTTTIITKNKLTGIEERNQMPFNVVHIATNDRVLVVSVDQLKRFALV